MPILSGGMWGSFTNLSHGHLGGTHVPLTVADGNVSLAALLATTAELNAPMRRPTPATPPPTVAETPTPPTWNKQ